MKDNFSQRSDQYAKYRPDYPAEYYEFLLSKTPGRKNAWDCGTGNGQVAEQLAKHFEKVFASDISAAQIAQAVPNEKIEYSVQPAEETNFSDNQFDLIVVAQAIHWFDFDRFYAEVNRTLKAGGILSVVGYDGPVISPEVNKVKSYFYSEIVGPYWDKERKHIDDRYANIPFPFEEIPSPQLSHCLNWNFEHFLGYLSTWSAVKHFIKDKGYDPVENFRNELKEAWGDDEVKEVCFPIVMRTGRKN